jgi:hypothetical protein
MSRLERCLDRNVVSLAIKVALLVGTILNLINHYDLLFGTPLTGPALVQVGLTYVVPYCVSTHGQVFGRRRDNFR